MYDPTIIQVEAATLTIDTVAQFQLPVDARGKPDKLVEVLRAEMGARDEAEGEQAIVFVRTKIRCEQLFRTLRDRGMNVRALHGDMSQGSRDGVMLAFKGGRVPILVATDVAARGLDISTVTHVINYDVPTSPDTYVHRIGRTGRVGRSGRAITFVEDRQKRELEAIERHIGTHDRAVASRARWPRRRRCASARAGTPSRTSPDATSDEPYVKLVLGGGRAAGLSVADIVAAVTSSAGLDGEAVRDVLVLERFSFLSVPAGGGRPRDRGARRTPACAARRSACERVRVGGGCQPPRCRPPKARSSSSCSTRTRRRPSRTSASSPPRASTTGSPSTG